MTNETLRDRLLHMLFDLDCEVEDEDRDGNLTVIGFNEHKVVDAVLAALGLDDLDAAVERMRRAMLSVYPKASANDEMLRRLLEAALTATPESEES